MNPDIPAAVQEAIARRGQGAPNPMMGQPSPSASPTGGVPPPMNPSQMTSSSNPPAGKPGVTQKFTPQTQQDLIVMALTEQLKMTNDLEKQKVKLGSSPAQSSPPPPPAQPQGSYMQAPNMATSEMQAGSPLGGPL